MGSNGAITARRQQGATPHHNRGWLLLQMKMGFAENIYAFRPRGYKKPAFSLKPHRLKSNILGNAPEGGNVQLLRSNPRRLGRFPVGAAHLDRDDSASWRTSLDPALLCSPL